MSFESKFLAPYADMSEEELQAQQEVDAFQEAVAEWYDKEKGPYFKELGHIVAAATSLEAAMRQVLSTLLGGHPSLWAVINPLSARGVVNAIDAIAKHRSSGEDVTMKMIDLVRSAGTALSERNIYVHGSWQHDPFETALVLQERANGKPRVAWCTSALARS